MHGLRLAVAAAALSSAGCAALVAGSGKRLDDVATRDQARREFGVPVATGVAGGRSYDEFRTYRKISEGWKGIYYCMGDVATLFLGEVVWLPAELFRAARGNLVGRTVRFVYDPSGDVSDIILDGDHVPILRALEAPDVPPRPTAGDSTSAE